MASRRLMKAPTTNACVHAAGATLKVPSTETLRARFRMSSNCKGIKIKKKYKSRNENLLLGVRKPTPHQLLQHGVLCYRRAVHISTHRLITSLSVWSAPIATYASSLALARTSARTLDGFWRVLLCVRILMSLRISSAWRCAGSGRWLCSLQPSSPLAASSSVNFAVAGQSRFEQRNKLPLSRV